MDNPKISVIVPIYNVEYYIREALDSLVNQTFIDHIEVLMVNGGSTDNSGNIIEEYARKYENFHAYHKDYGGPSSSRNYGLNFACGDYIYFMDSDDFLMHDSLEKLYNFAIKNDYDVVTSNFLRFDSKSFQSISSGRYVFKEYRGNIENTNLYEYVNLAWDMPVWNKIIKRELLEKNKIRFSKDNIFQEDNLFTIEVYTKAKNVGILNEITYFWRIREVGESITQNKNLEAGLELFETFYLVNKFITENIHDEDILYQKYYKILTVDIYYFLFRIKNNYSRKFQEYLLESVFDMVSLIPKKYFKKVPTYYQALYETVLNKDFENCLLFVSTDFKYNPTLPENLGQYYLDKIDLKKDAHQANLFSQVNNIFFNDGAVVIEFANRVINFRNFNKTEFTLINPDFGNKVIPYDDGNTLTIPLELIEFGKSVVLTTCYLENIKKETIMKSYLNKRFNFKEFDLIIGRDVLGNLNLVKSPINNAEVIIEDVLFNGDKFQFKGKISEKISDVTLKDSFDLVSFKYPLNYEDDEFLLEIDYCDFIKAPIKKWEFIGAKFSLTQEYNFSNEYYLISIKNHENGVIIELKLSNGS